MGTKNAELRTRVDSLLDSFIESFYKEVAIGRHLMDSQQINMDYYKRHNIEIILRLRMKRTCDSYVIRHLTKHDPVQAKAWSEYTADEMLHDAFFAKDLEAVGVSKKEIYSTEPLLSTKLLMGYFLQAFEYEDSPLALIASVYFIEYTTVKTQPGWLDNLERVLGKEKIAGARAHVATDLDGDHDDFVWNVLASLIKTPEDEARLFYHLRNIYRLWEFYFNEIHQLVVEGQQDAVLKVGAPVADQVTEHAAVV